MATAKNRQTAAAAAQAKGQSDQYVTLTTVDHDGDRYAPGEPITLDPISAARRSFAQGLTPIHHPEEAR